MTRPTNIIDWLRTEPAFRDAASRLARLVELQAMLAAAYPQAPLTVLSLGEDGTLALATRNAADAARLRQLEPSVVAALRRRGAPVERLRIRPRRNLDRMTTGPVNAPRAPIPADALASFEALEHQSQSEGLRRAISALLRHQRAAD